ncbi:PREDICTED: uncharacterized protein LOC104585818 [Nelumbo nucifera]|uniref:Peptidoglycan binding-like domain-containing protein n=2 Tax=Nelumbo nucifera TaxID=4432 RepID=A0A822XU30_NELNU|nr:PREDICTED: uncharacterized protein LOC104585818 [Nelumbo nucifera]DAD23890.1 TPA_asm: hypothetical protein HUJ06_025353 [Nelumbo nucifera]
MASSVPLRLHPPQPPPVLSHGLRNLSKLKFTPFQIRKFSSLPLKRFPAFASSSSSNTSDWDREEIRWLREEQRWLREEQRWIREESRWNSEREALLREISELKLQIEALERQNSLQGASMSETVANIASLLQTLKDAELNSPKQHRIAESGSGPTPMLLGLDSEKVKETVVEEVRVLESSKENKEEEKQEKVKEVRSLRMGSEGEDVQAMQEALLILGFYSGEEDMEFSSFSSGTERAVKTWQASIGAREDGIMTAELLQRLYMKQGSKNESLKTNAYQKGDVVVPDKEGANGAAVVSVTEISEIQETVVKEDGATEIEVSQQRVFLLGENRWEEPSRLRGRDKKIGGDKPESPTTKCLACRGEGHLLCTECDGTGEPNIEPQFLEWVDEGAKCPYCEGLGYTVCDVCEGKGING